MAAPAHYEPTLESVRRHPVPDWYHDAKLGIFIHWTPASVPGFAPREKDLTELLRDPGGMQTASPYAEWYQNSLRFPESAVAKHHREVHRDRPYDDFAEIFRRMVESDWRPEAWAERFAAAGARYVVLVTKHHDGFCLWPSRVANPRKPGWHTRRDCVGELAAAVRARGLRFGVYYSGGLDWTFEPRAIRGIGDLLAAVPLGDYAAYADAHFRELIEHVRPDMLWNDIAWPGDRGSYLRLVADYYNALPDGVVNDRWLPARPWTRLLRLGPVRRLAEKRIARALAAGGELLPPSPGHADARTPEYAVFSGIRREKWECCRGMDKSFGYNRASLPSDFLTREALIHSLCDITSKNGNLLLNVGPRGTDAEIPDPQLERLDWLASFTRRTGEALVGTRPWRRAEGTTAEGIAVRFTRKAGTLYALLLGRPAGDSVTLRDVVLTAGASARVVGGGPIETAGKGGDLFCRFVAPLPDEPAHAIALESAA